MMRGFKVFVLCVLIIVNVIANKFTLDGYELTTRLAPSGPRSTNSSMLERTTAMGGQFIPL